MKKIVYETGATQYDAEFITPLSLQPIHRMEACGATVVITKDIPDEPKVERCEIVDILNLEQLVYRDNQRHEDAPLSEAINEPAFSGFEFENGDVGITPWRIMLKPDVASGLVFGSNPTYIEHAVAVLFRKDK